MGGEIERLGALKKLKNCELICVVVNKKVEIRCTMPQCPNLKLMTKWRNSQKHCRQKTFPPSCV